jgi:hypothetical protein
MEGDAVIHFCKNDLTMGAKQKYSNQNILPEIISVF